MQEYPKEVRNPPVLLVALVGATPVHPKLTEALHEASVVAAGQRRAKYVSLDYGHSFPPCRRGAKDLPGYQVGGVLKRRWLQKICGEIPAVVVVCFDWSSEPTPPAQEEALVQLARARQLTRNRDLRLLVLVVVHADTADPDGLCAPLRQAPDVSGVVAARGVGDVPAKAPKLERLVHQFGMSFYGDEEKRHRRLKQPRPGMPAWALNALQVRMHLKVAFLGELRKDTRGALKCYIKAYEQLIHGADIAPAVERLSLCNHITLRMYQLYLGGVDVVAAVHHCRVHISTLSTATFPGDKAGAVSEWRRWHWLAQHHQLFAELLDSVSQQLPNLIDQSDLWQFPGFHYQCAAAYARRLGVWAAWALQPGNLAEPSGLGGELVPSPYVGQASILERPGDVPDAEMEVVLRLAKEAAREAHSSRRLQLLSRALAMYRERGYTRGMSACSVRMAEEYLGDGNFNVAGQSYDRLLQAPRRAACGNGENDEIDDTEEGPGPKSPPAAGASVSAAPLWPALRRLALERAVLCGCQELAPSEPVPSLCFRSCALPAQYRSPGAGEKDEKAAVPPAPEAVRWVLPAIFQHLVPSTAAARGARNALEEEKLLKFGVALAARAAAAEPEVKLDVPLGLAASACAELKGSAAGGLLRLVVSLEIVLVAELEIDGAVACTSIGDVVLAVVPGAPSAADQTARESEDCVLNKVPWRWAAGKSLRLEGNVPGCLVAATPDLELNAVRLQWSAVPWATLVVDKVGTIAALGPPGPHNALLWPAKFAATPVCALPIRGASQDVEAEAAPFLRVEAFWPTGAGAALAGEDYLIHLVLRLRPAASPAPKLHVEVSACLRPLASDGDVATSGANEGEGPELTASLLRTPQREEYADRARPPWSKISLDAAEASAPGAVVAELDGDEVKLRDPVLGFVSASLVDGPLDWAEGEEVVVVPVAVRSDRPAAAILDVDVCCFEEGKSTPDSGATALARAAIVPPVAVTFRPALQASFDRVASTGGAPEPVRILLRPVAGVDLELRGVDVGGAVVLGPLGKLAVGSSRSYAIPRPPPGDAPQLAVHFARADPLALFPWPDVREVLARAAEAPEAMAKFSIPAQPLVPEGMLSVSLKHSPTGSVAEPLALAVRVTATGPSAREVKIRVLPCEGGDFGDFLVSGPTATHALLAPAPGSDCLETCLDFQLIPLRPGWVEVPRVQVAGLPDPSAPTREATSAQASIFVFPHAQPVVRRNSR